MKFKQVALISQLILLPHLATGASFNPGRQAAGKPLKQKWAPELGSKPTKAVASLQVPLRQSQKQQQYTKATNLLKNNQLEKAAIKIKALIEEYPNEAAFYSLQGSLETLEQQKKLAINSYQKAIELDPQQLKSYLAIATLYIDLQEYKQARTYANHALTMDDKHPQTDLLLAKIAEQEVHLEETENFLLSAQQKAANNPRLQIIVTEKLNQFYLRHQLPQKSLKLTQELIKKQPKDHTALALLANAQIINHETKAGIATLEQIIQQEPEDTRFRLKLAQLLIKTSQQRERAIQLLEEVNTIVGDGNIEIQSLRILLLTQLKLYSEALHTINKIRKLEPESGLAQALEGRLYIAKNKPQLALSAYQASYKINPLPETLDAMLRLMIAKDAILMLKQQLKNNPKNLAAHFRLGTIYLQQGETFKAEHHYQAILNEKPDHPVILNNLAWMNFEQGKLEAALSFAKKAYEVDPDSPNIADTYGLILAKQGKLTESIDIFKTILKRTPNSYYIQFHLAETYLLNKQTEKAIEKLQLVVNAWQEFPEKPAADLLLQKLLKNKAAVN